MNVETWDNDKLYSLLPKLDAQQDKYTRGEHTLVVGSDAYPGSACLAAAASSRAGTGYTLVVCGPKTVDIMHGWMPSVVAMSWNGWKATSLPFPRPGHPVAVSLGSGFDGTDEVCRSITLNVLTKASSPVLVDGGALTTLSSDEGLEAAVYRATQGWETIVTPHGGEAARLAKGAHIPDDGEHPEELCVKIAQTYRCVCVLKGPNTYITDGDTVVEMKDGTVALAKAGTGDVLAGIIGSFMAQGVGLMDAGVLGATLHAWAGNIAAEKYGERSIIAEDLIDALPKAIERLENTRH